jgi:hypothetical protein
MASTNKTNNFNLSQFIETDKPTFLGDYNTDMNKIDDALEANKLNSEKNNNSIGNLQELTTENNLNLVNAINEIYNEAHPLFTLYNNLRNLVTWQMKNKAIATENLTLASGSGTFEASDIKFNYTNAKNQFKISGTVILRQFTTSTMLEFNVNNTGLDTFSSELNVVGYAQNNTSNIIYPLYAKVQNNKLVVTAEFSDTTPADYNIVFIDAVRNV